MRTFILAMAALYALKLAYQLLELGGPKFNDKGYRFATAFVIAVRVGVLLWATSLISAEGN